ncbi:NUDIX domain-containing protein [Natronosalvus rutilus]|uniref:NUDIX hydrolase n=1 Tax=Natronosalvus rutilus TaxID=2953753 RepID=A0A9E7NA94_9EURY|nr:NUDIX hydrolase [Natronosalvus rutilus]UTF53344.1 NUDIX hydrolase [Natronosalvus rutilus]
MREDGFRDPPDPENDNCGVGDDPVTADGSTTTDGSIDVDVDAGSDDHVHADASVRGLIEDDGTYLLLKHDMPGGPIWGVPGGRARIGEDPRDALVREVYEETRLEVAIGDPLEAFAHTWADGEQGTVSVVFECAVVGGTVDIEANPNDDEPISEYVWLEPTALDDVPMEPELQRLLERYAN